MLYNVFTVTNHLRLNALSFVACSVFNIVLVLFLVAYTDYDLYAIAGISSLMKTVQNFIVIVPYSSKLIGKPWSSYLPGAAISTGCFAGTAALSLAVAWLIGTSNWLSLVITVLVSCLIAWCLVFRFTFNQGERKAMLSVLGNKVHGILR